jgi:tetratricopeptide (TPR) repeat protein
MTDTRITLNTSKFDAMLRQTGHSEAERVPIPDIFELDFRMLEQAPEWQKAIIDKYESLRQILMDAVSKEFASTIIDADEEELFRYMAEILQEELGESFDEDVPMFSLAIDNDQFNCYTSSVLFADVLTSLGKDVRVLLVPCHVIIAGKTCAFETTAVPSGATFPLQEVGLRYPTWQEVSVKGLLGVAHEWCGYFLATGDTFNEALVEFDEAIAINGDASSYVNKGVALCEMGLPDAAIECYDTALTLDPRFAEAWSNKGSALCKKGLLEAGNECFDKALDIDPGLVQARSNKIAALIALNRLEEAVDCSVRVLGAHSA